MSRIKYFFCASIVLMSCFISCDDDDETVDTIAKIQANKEAGEKYLASKSTENGVREDPSGLLYEIIDDADGDKPGAADSVCIHYDAFRIDGRQFASVTDTLELGSLEEGLRIGLRHTPEGATYKYYIPYYLMYNASSKTFKYNNDTVNVSEYSALVYEMRLDSIIFVK